MKLLFIDYSSAFNTKVPLRLFTMLRLGVNTQLCRWVLDFRYAAVCPVNTITFSTGVPQECVLSPVLYTLFTSNCVAIYTKYSIIKEYKEECKEVLLL